LLKAMMWVIADGRGAAVDTIVPWEFVRTMAEISAELAASTDAASSVGAASRHLT
jgi:hypothetical protein